MRHKNQVFELVFAVLVVACLLLLTHWLDPLILQLVSQSTGKRIQTTWPGYLQTAAVAGLAVSLGAWALLRWGFPTRAQIRQFTDRILRAREQFREPNSAGRPWRFSWLDGLILILFLLYGFVLFLDKIQGPYPYVKLGSDAGNIISFAAAQEHPELFPHDPLLSDPENLRSYATLNIPILNQLKNWTGNYTLAFAWMIPPQTFIALAGFYLLGMVLFKNRFWAVLLTLILAIPYEINLLETWGITKDPVTRFTFQAILPYLLALMITFGSRLWIWPVILLSTGILAYIHPVSTPAWAFAFWLGLLAYLPQDWGWRKKLLWMAGAGLLVAIALLPYAMNYLGAGGKSKALSYDLAIFVIERHFPGDILDIPRSIWIYIKLTTRSGLLPVSLILTSVLFALRWQDRRRLKVTFLWLTGILIVSLLIPWAEHEIERVLRIVPVETELPRGLRYGVFFQLLFSVWCLYEIYRRLGNRVWRFVPLALAVLLTAGWLVMAHTERVIPHKLAACLKQGQILCVQYDHEDRAILALRDLTPPGSPVFTTFANQGHMAFSLPVRYLAQRPLVFSYKDRGQLVTSHSSDLAVWFERLTIMDKIQSENLSAEEKMDRYLPLAQDWGAKYILADLKLPPDELQARGLQVIYENDQYLLLEIQ